MSHLALRMIINIIDAYYDTVPEHWTRSMKHVLLYAWPGDYSERINKAEAVINTIPEYDFITEALLNIQASKGNKHPLQSGLGKTFVQFDRKLKHKSEKYDMITDHQQEVLYYYQDISLMTIIKESGNILHSQILFLIYRGYTLKDICEELKINYRTLKKILSEISCYNS